MNCNEIEILFCSKARREVQYKTLLKFKDWSSDFLININILCLFANKNVSLLHDLIRRLINILYNRTSEFFPVQNRFLVSDPEEPMFGVCVGQKKVKDNLGVGEFCVVMRPVA